MGTVAKGDAPDLNKLPPKGLIALFGAECLGTVLRNLDDPSDGVLEVIKDPETGDILRVKNPPTGAWCRWDKGIAQGLRAAAENGVPMEEGTRRKRKQRDRSASPPRLEQKEARTGSPPSAPQRERSPSPVYNLLPVKLEQMVEQMVENKFKKKEIARLHWSLLRTEMRAGRLVREPDDEATESEPSQHTGMTLDFDAFGVDDE